MRCFRPTFDLPYLTYIISGRHFVTLILKNNNSRFKIKWPTSALAPYVFYLISLFRGLSQKSLLSVQAKVCRQDLVVFSMPEIQDQVWTTHIHTHTHTHTHLDMLLAHTFHFTSGTDLNSSVGLFLTFCASPSVTGFIFISWNPFTPGPDYTTVFHPQEAGWGVEVRGGGFGGVEWIP